MKIKRVKGHTYSTDVICGKIALSEVPRRVRLKNDRCYIFAMRYYRYNRMIENPLLVWKSDIDTLPDEHPDKTWLYNNYIYYKLYDEELLANGGPNIRK